MILDMSIRFCAYHLQLLPVRVHVSQTFLWGRPGHLPDGHTVVLFLEIDQLAMTYARAIGPLTAKHLLVQVTQVFMHSWPEMCVGRLISLQLAVFTTTMWCSPVFHIFVCILILCPFILGFGIRHIIRHR